MQSGKRITVKDLARICGVSIGTVDRALNGRARINPDTKERILSAAREHGYIKNEYARTLASGRTSQIGVIVLDLHDGYFPALLEGINEEAHLRGYSTLFTVSNGDPEEEKNSVAGMLSMNVAGIIVCSVLNDPDYYESIRTSGTAVVAVSNRLSASVPYSGINDRAAMTDAVRHIASHGYDSICYISPALSKQNINISAQYERYIGAKSAADEYKIGFDVIRDKESLASLRPDTSRRTALLCSSDTYTVHCIAMFGDLINSRKLGIMGFDEIESVRMIYPHLSAISYNTRDIGKNAVRLLFDAEQDLLVPHIVKPGTTV